MSRVRSPSAALLFYAGIVSTAAHEVSTLLEPVRIGLPALDDILRVSKVDSYSRMANPENDKQEYHQLCLFNIMVVCLPCKKIVSVRLGEEALVRLSGRGWANNPSYDWQGK